MNRNNNIFNKNEVENKLKDFKEGKDYSVSREGKKLIYNFHNNWLRDEFGRNWTTVYEVAENWDSDNFNHHREEGKYINNDKGTEITYRYEHRINKESGDYYNEWSRGEKFKDNSKATWTLRARPNPKKIEPNFPNFLEELKWKHNQLVDKLSGLQDRPESDFGVNGKEKKEYEIVEVKKNIAKIERKIENGRVKVEREKDNSLGRPDWIPCSCGKTFAKNREHWMVEPKDGGGRDHFCSSQCAIDKYPNDRIEYYTPTRQSSNKSSDLAQENQELRQQLAEVQKQLVEVLEELKKLKTSVNGKESEKLSQQIVQNERLIKEGKDVSVVEVQEQVNKSQALMKEFNNVSSTNDRGSMLPYVIGGSMVLALVGIISYFLLKKSKRK